MGKEWVGAGKPGFATHSTGRHFEDLASSIPTVSAILLFCSLFCAWLWADSGLLLGLGEEKEEEAFWVAALSVKCNQ